MFKNGQQLFAFEHCFKVKQALSSLIDPFV